MYGLQCRWTKCICSSRRLLLFICLFSTVFNTYLNQQRILGCYVLSLACVWSNTPLHPVSNYDLYIEKKMSVIISQRRSFARDLESWIFADSSVILYIICSLHLCVHSDPLHLKVWKSSSLVAHHSQLKANQIYSQQQHLR